jgi:membrane-bound lytic murein transglycosylase A
MTFYAQSASPYDLKQGRIEPKTFADLNQFDSEDFLQVWSVFVSSCSSIVAAKPELRVGLTANGDVHEVCRKALLANPKDSYQARQFFEKNFSPFEIHPDTTPDESAPGFLTAYYEPVVLGSLTASSEFREPLYARPDDLITLSENSLYPGIPAGLSAARRGSDGVLEPYPVRKQIDLEHANLKPLIWVKDAIEAFMIHIQGSATIKLDSGRDVRISYAGKNGHPYTSIGKSLVNSGEMQLESMTLSTLKKWVRDNGQELGEKGRNLLHENASYIFFSINSEAGRPAGPIGGAGVPLIPMRSIAVDRKIWSYGLPFWIEAELPLSTSNPETTAFRRLMIAQDTGSAIIGPARADLYFGSGDDAGVLAGNIRHKGRMFVFLPIPTLDGPPP